MSDERKPANDSTDGDDPDVPGTGLTPAMKRVLWAVGAIVLIGLAVAVVLFLVDGAGTRNQPVSTQSPGRGPVTGATPTTASEVQPPDPTAPERGRIPRQRTAEPLLTQPPAPGSATGQLVPGFPTAILGPVPDSDVISSQVTTDGGVTQVTLVARTDAGADAVRAHYRTLWSDLGLTDEGPDVGADIAYSDALSALSLAFESGTGTGTVYVVHGVFRRV